MIITGLMKKIEATAGEREKGGVPVSAQATVTIQSGVTDYEEQEWQALKGAAVEASLAL